jgi:hypothetical protein
VATGEYKSAWENAESAEFIRIEQTGRNIHAKRPSKKIQDLCSIHQ